MSIIYGDFGNKKNTLKEKVNTALKQVPGSDVEDSKQTFLLIVDTGSEFKILSDVELPEFNVMLDICKFTVLQGAYNFLGEYKE
tara:strand:- start:1058 stop:1309 length:252 start_codon:yes stop_codon:yes gene_type:complete